MTGDLPVGPHGSTAGHSPNSPSDLDDLPHTPGQSAFGVVHEIDFGAPALDSDAESAFTHAGFAQQVENTQDDRIAPDTLFAGHHASPSVSPVPVSPVSVPPVPVSPVSVPPVPVSPVPVPPVLVSPQAAPLPAMTPQPAPIAGSLAVTGVLPVPVPAGAPTATSEPFSALAANADLVGAAQSAPTPHSRRRLVIAATGVVLAAAAGAAAYLFGYLPI